MPARETRAIGAAPDDVRLAAPRGLKVVDETIQREGGQYGAGLIRGLSVITRGEAKGHGIWIDSTFLDQVADAISAKGLKSRFTHPGISSDGLGKQLGRVRDGEVHGDQVRADEHFLKSAHRTPAGGDLAGYVMDYAEETPEDFGTSIVYTPDHDAEAAFRAKHSTKQGDYDVFISPDKDNVNNYVHVRLAAVRAVDVVDLPAANPGGLFSEGHLPQAAEQCLEYALGLTDRAPAELLLGVHPERVRIFVQDFMARHGVALSFDSPDDSGMEGRSAMAELTKATLEELKSERPDLVGQLKSDFAEETAGKAAADVTKAREEALAEGAKLERERRGAIVEKAREYKVELEDATIESLLAADDTVEVAEKAIMQRRLELLEAAAPKSQGAADEPEHGAGRLSTKDLQRLTAEEAWEKNAKLPSGARVKDEFSLKGAFLASAKKDSYLRGWFAEADADDES